MLRTAQSLPLEWAFDTGLRPRPFPDEAASLLPGPLAVTRTGLTPASDDELTTQDQPPTRSTSCPLGARQSLTAPPGQHPRASRTGQPTRTEPLLDRDRVGLYREHRASERNHTALLHGPAKDTA